MKKLLNNLPRLSGALTRTLKISLLVLQITLLLSSLSGAVFAHTADPSDPTRQKNNINTPEWLIGGICPAKTIPDPKDPKNSILVDFDNHVSTSLGCIHTKPEDIASGIINVAIRVGGGIAFVFLLLGAYKFINSGGSPDNIDGAKAMITSAIAGLLMIIFSVLILRTIGYDVLGIPGFDQSSFDLKVP